MSVIEEKNPLPASYYGTDLPAAQKIATTPTTIVERIEAARATHKKSRLHAANTDTIAHISIFNTEDSKPGMPLPSEVDFSVSYFDLLTNIVTKLERIQKKMESHALKRSKISGDLALKMISNLKKKLKESEGIEENGEFWKSIDDLIPAFLGGALIAAGGPVALLAGICLVTSSQMHALFLDLKQAGSKIDTRKLEQASKALAFVGNGVGIATGISAFHGSFASVLVSITQSSTQIMVSSNNKEKAVNEADSALLTRSLEVHKDDHKNAEQTYNSLGENKVYFFEKIARVILNEIKAIQNSNKKQIQG